MNEQDTPGMRNIAVVDCFFEQKYFNDGHAIGKHFCHDQKHSGWFESRCDRRHAFLGAVGEDASDVFSRLGAERSYQRTTLSAVRGPVWWNPAPARLASAWRWGPSV
jgi:hypothetical protein